MRPRSWVDASLVDDLDRREKIATPTVMRRASAYWVSGYAVSFSTFPIIITGMIFEL